MAVSIREAKTHLSHLIDRVLAGEEIVIARAGKPVAKLVAIERRAAGRSPGAVRGHIRVGDDFEDPLPDELRRYFE